MEQNLRLHHYQIHLIYTFYYNLPCLIFIKIKKHPVLKVVLFFCQSNLEKHFFYLILPGHSIQFIILRFIFKDLTYVILLISFIVL